MVKFHHVTMVSPQMFIGAIKSVSEHPVSHPDLIHPDNLHTTT